MLIADKRLKGNIIEVFKDFIGDPSIGICGFMTYSLDQKAFRGVILASAEIQDVPLAGQTQEKGTDGTGISNQREALLDCLIDALFLALSSDTSKEGIEHVREVKG
mgnify:CR=1 FL=1